MAPVVRPVPTIWTFPAPAILATPDAYVMKILTSVPFRHRVATAPLVAIPTDHIYVFVLADMKDTTVQ